MWSICKFPNQQMLLEGLLSFCIFTFKLVIHCNCANRIRPQKADDDSFKFLPYQLWMVVYWTTMVVTGDGEPGFGSGEGA